MRSSRPTVIHAHYGPVAALQVGLVRALGVPEVASFYGYDATEARFTQSRTWRRRYRRLFQEAGAVIAEGPAMASRLEALGCPSTKIHVVRMPADERALEHCVRRESPDFLVTLAGRFVEKKGFDVGIRAFARALRGSRDARLMLVGGGPMERMLRNVAEEERVGDQVIWKGRLPFESFMESVAASNLALYPSRTDRDGGSEGGAPVTLIEGQWVGTPSIVSDHDDLPFVAAPTGSVVLDPADVDAWAEALLSLYRDRDRLTEMSMAAREFARAHHAPGDNLRAREAIYDSVS